MSARKLMTGAAGLAVLALGACASEKEPAPPPMAAIPIAIGYPATTQNKMQAAYHWEVLARQIAGQVAPHVKATGKNLHVAVKQPRSPFYDGFRTLIVEALVAEGVNPVTEPGGALVLDYAVQILRHQASREGMDVTGPGGVKPTPTEVIVTTEIVNGGQYAFKTNDIFYVNADDATAHYYTPPPRPVIPTQARAVRLSN